MTHLIYNDTEPKRQGGFGNVHNMDPVKAFLRHYGNYLYLQFISTKTDNRLERHQALKELTICERKMNYWKRHPNYRTEAVTLGVQELKRQWNITD